MRKQDDQGLSREVKVNRVLNESTKVASKLEEGHVIQYRPQPFIFHDRSWSLLPKITWSSMTWLLVSDAKASSKESLLAPVCLHSHVLER